MEEERELASASCVWAGLRADSFMLHEVCLVQLTHFSDAGCNSTMLTPESGK